MTRMRGIFTIPVTPFRDDLEVDYDSLMNTIDFCLACGTHGFLLSANASECYALSPEEKAKVLTLSMKRIGDRVPVIMGCTASTSEETIEGARIAESYGVSAVSTMFPIGCDRPVGDDDIYAFFEALSKAVSIPVFIQDLNVANYGVPISSALLVRMIRDFENVQFVKEEVMQAPQKITQIFELAKDLPPGSFSGVMGGAGCKNLLQEYDRGICGSMPACDITDILVDVWNLLDAGRRGIAWELFEKVLMLIDFNNMYPIVSNKEILFRRGIIRTPRIREIPSGFRSAFDAINHRELDLILERMKPYFRIGE